MIQKLKEENLINDFDFAVWWTEQRQEFKKKSHVAIRSELKQKGIDAELIAKALEQGEDELKTAQELWKKHQKRFDNLPEKERFQKAGAFLQRKGYQYEIIKKVLNDHD